MNTAIIDSDHMLYTFTGGIKVLDEFGEPVKENGKFVYLPKPFEQMCSEVDEYIRSILTKTGVNYYIGFISGSSAYRKMIYPEYKGNRKDFVKPPFFDELRDYIVSKYNIINLKNIWNIIPNLYETDDWVVSYARQTPDSIIISPDKDLLLIEGTHYDPRVNEWVTTKPDKAIVAFWLDMIVGQNGDNIKGLPGKGEVFAKNLFEEDAEGTPYHSLILQEYIKHFGEYKGIHEFYKNYISLKLIDNLDITAFKTVEFI
jgi:5'-3' exonuclease